MVKTRSIRKVPNETVAGHEWTQSTSRTDLERAAVLRGLEVDLMFRLCSLCYLMLLNQYHAVNYPNQKLRIFKNHHILTETEAQRINTFWTQRADMQKMRNIRERLRCFKERQVPP